RDQAIGVDVVGANGVGQFQDRLPSAAASKLVVVDGQTGSLAGHRIRRSVDLVGGKDGRAAGKADAVRVGRDRCAADRAHVRANAGDRGRSRLADLDGYAVVLVCE